MPWSLHEALQMFGEVHEAAPPPSAVICDFFSQHEKETATESEITELAKRVLLPVNEVQIWLKHRAAQSEAGSSSSQESKESSS